MKHKIFIGALLAAILGVGNLSQAAFATKEIQPRTVESQPVATNDDNKSIRPTFIEEQPTEDTSSLIFGRNLLLAGNILKSDASSQGLLFSAGNVLTLTTSSEYAFLAGNSLDISSEVEKDLFVAGNTVTISNSAKIGRDVFATGNVITVNTDVKGDLSVAASKVVIDDININGNLNIDAASVVIEGKVDVGGKFIINADADIRGMDSISYAELEKYENYRVEITAADIMVSTILGIIALFVAFVIVLAVFPGINKKIHQELTSIQFGKDLVVGICALFLIPIVCIFLVISFIGAAAGVILILAYIMMLCLSQCFAGFWLGKLIMEKSFHSQMNPFLEALVGIIIIRVFGLIPLFGGYITLIAVVLGLGLIMQCLRTRNKKLSGNSVVVEEAEVVTEETVKKPKSNKSAVTEESKDETEEE